MNKIVAIIFICVSLFAYEIEISKAEYKLFGEIVEVNAKVVQLSNQKQNIVSRLGGHLEKYFVKPGQKVYDGDKIALVKSLELAKLTAEFIYLSKQLNSAKKSLESIKKLYKKGLASKKELNDESIKVDEILAKLSAVESQLISLDIEPKKLKKPTDSLVIRAHAQGVVSKLLTPAHSNLQAMTTIAEIVKENGFYAIAYVSLKDAFNMDSNTRGELIIGGKTYLCSFEQLLPKVDEETQRARALFWIESQKEKLFLNAFGVMRLSMKPFKRYVTIKKSSLTMFKGEWVIFVPQEEDHKDKESINDVHHHKEEGHKEHLREEHNDSGVKYLPLAIKVVDSFEDNVAVLGVEPGTEYVSKGVYFVKSLLLRSELDGHGH